MAKRSHILLAFVALGLCLATYIGWRGNILYQVDGSQVQGHLIQEDAKSYFMFVDGETREIDKATVKHKDGLTLFLEYLKRPDLLFRSEEKSP